MPADLTSANTDDRFKLCLPMAASAQANGACGHAVRPFPWSSTSPSPIRVIRHRVNGLTRDWTRNFAPPVSLLRVIDEGADS
jgi:hypothetical protein